MGVPDFEKVMLPAEAAKFLNVSRERLGRLRRAGKVRATRVQGTNLHTYTLADLRQADTQKEKTGPKPGKRVSQEPQILE